MQWPRDQTVDYCLSNAKTNIAPSLLNRVSVIIWRRKGKLLLTMKINIEQSFDQIKDYWSPKVISRVNDQYVKIAKVKGELAWHNHKDEDELFLVVRGRLLIQLEGAEIELNAGDMYVVPKGAMHNPVADEECWVMLVETVTTKHTGDVDTPMTKSIADQLA